MKARGIRRCPTSGSGNDTSLKFNRIPGKIPRILLHKTIFPRQKLPMVEVAKLI